MTPPLAVSTSRGHRSQPAQLRGTRRRCPCTQQPPTQDTRLAHTRRGHGRSPGDEHRNLDLTVAPTSGSLHRTARPDQLRTHELRPSRPAPLIAPAITGANQSSLDQAPPAKTIRSARRAAALRRPLELGINTTGGRWIEAWMVSLNAREVDLSGANFASRWGEVGPRRVRRGYCFSRRSRTRARLDRSRARSSLRRASCLCQRAQRSSAICVTANVR
jgi:hypothetical protein